MQSPTTPVQTLVMQTDAPIKRAVYDTRTPEEQARDVGASVLDWLRRNGKLEAIERSRQTAVAMLLSMIFEHSRVEIEGEFISLMVRTPVKQIAAGILLSETSGYQVVGLLIKAKLVDRISAYGTTAHAYQILAPVPRSIPPTVVNGARAINDAPSINDTSCASKSLMARAFCAAEGGVSSIEDSRPQFSGPKQGASSMARAATLTDDDDDELESNTSHHQSPDAERNAEATAVVSLLVGHGMFRRRACKLARTKTLLQATAAVVLMLSLGKKVGTPGAWLGDVLDDGEIPQWAIAEARKRLNLTQAATPEPAMTAARTKGGADDDNYALKSS